jgi:hypothetical protein
MPDIILDLRRLDYISDQNVAVSAWRAYAEAVFTSPIGIEVSFSCIVDPGAPFSVLPFSLWHDRNLHWTPLWQQLTRQGGQAPEPLRWQDVNCALGDTSVHIIDGQAGVRSGRFLVVAKFASQRLLNPNLEMIALLGMNFLTDNHLRLVLDGTGADLIGYLSFP